MPIDANTSDSDVQAGTEDPQVETSKPVDYAAKYRGEARRAAALQKQNEALQKEYDDALARAEKAESSARTATKDLKTKFDELQTQFDVANKAKEKAEKELSKINAQKDTRAKIKEKFSPLLEMFDDDLLKNPDDFSKPEDYDAYLGKILAKVAVQDESDNSDQKTADEPDPFAKQRRASGATPPIPNNAHDGKKGRTKEQVLDEMDKIDSMKEPQKYAALEEEYDKLVLQERKW